MFRRRAGEGDRTVRLNRGNLPWLLGSGVAAGGLSGFFGIGGGFLVVPSLMLATGMPILNAVGSSLVAVTAFGVTTAGNYAVSGMLDWQIAALFIAGSVAGGMLGARAAQHLAARRGILNTLFAAMILTVAAYMLVRSAAAV